MQQKQLRFDKGFDVVAGNDRAQVATMVLEAGDSTGGPDNRHRGSDQWMYVIAGEGAAIVSGKRCALKPGTVLLIEHGENHEIRSSGREPLRTLNLYVPPAYAADGDPLPSGRP